MEHFSFNIGLEAVRKRAADTRNLSREVSVLGSAACAVSQGPRCVLVPSRWHLLPGEMKDQTGEERRSARSSLKHRRESSLGRPTGKSEHLPDEKSERLQVPTCRPGELQGSGRSLEAAKMALGHLRSLLAGAPALYEGHWAVGRKEGSD